MKLLIQSAMIFFGTLMAAAVVALGEPARADASARGAAAGASQSVRHDARGNQLWIDLVSSTSGFGAR